MPPSLAAPQDYPAKDSWTASEYRELRHAFEKRIGETTVAKIAGCLARDLGMVGSKRQVEELLGSLVPVRLMTVVGHAMLAWLQAKGSCSKYRLQVSGCREGASRWLLLGTWPGCCIVAV